MRRACVDDQLDVLGAGQPQVHHGGGFVPTACPRHRPSDHPGAYFHSKIPNGIGGVEHRMDSMFRDG
ncbi:hypothetical protein [Nocardia beijingensis]|uniref:Uncharacterized protein n=1 Tax=Nocardia beijingensis TaxID=95162 RepID=A0ABW7WI92_9NOCA